MKFRSAFQLLAFSTVALATLIGCSPSAPTGAENASTKPSSTAPKNGGDVKIAFIVKQPEEPWFQLEWKFAQEAATKDGFTLLPLAATDGEQVLPKIENAAAQGAKGLIICSPDVKLGPAIVAACAKHDMKLMSVDDQLVGPSGPLTEVHHLGINASDIGKMVGKGLIAEMKKRAWNMAEVGMLVVTWDQLDTAHKRTQGEIDTLKAAGMKSTQIFQAPEKTTDIPGGREAASSVLAQHPEIKHWIMCAMNDSAVIGAVRATESFHLTPENVIAIGINGQEAVEDFKRDKPTALYGSVLLQAKRHGFDTADMMYQWIKDGKEPPKETYTDGILITRDNYVAVLKDQGITK